MPDIFVSQPQDKKQENTQEDTLDRDPSLSVPNHKLFGAFSLYPEDVEFETKESEEKIILLLRQHPIVNVKWILISILMFFVPSVARFFGVFSGLPSGFDLVITLAWYLFTMAYALENFLSWYFNVYFVTSLRVVDVDFYNLIYKQVSDANISKIQDVTYNMGGVARTIFNYGNVFIQTAAEVSEFEFLAVPSPDKVAKIINDLVSKREEGH
jgi:membrane protein YdbS with pleckstrin-like domain